MVHDEPEGRGQRVYLTVDLLPLISAQLVLQGSLHTLSILLLLSQETYEIVAPILYRHLHFTTNDHLSSFLSSLDFTSKAKGTSLGSTSSTGEDDINSRTTASKERVFSMVKSVQMDTIPSSSTANLILSLSERLPLQHLFPSCSSLTIHSNALKLFPIRGTSTSYNTSKAALKIYNSIRKLCRPRYLTILRPEHDHQCTAYREMHTYFLSHKTDQRTFWSSLSLYWPELRVVNWGTVHLDEAMAVAGPKVENVYEIPNCDCVKDGQYAVDLFGCVLDWYAGKNRPVPRGRMVLKGEENIVKGVKSRMEGYNRDLLGEEEENEGAFEICLQVVTDGQHQEDS